MLTELPACGSAHLTASTTKPSADAAAAYVTKGDVVVQLSAGAGGAGLEARSSMPPRSSSGLILHVCYVCVHAYCPPFAQTLELTKSCAGGRQLESSAEDQQPLKMPRHKSITTVSVMATAVVEVPSEAAEDDEEEAAAPAPSDALEVMMAGKGEGKGMDPC